MNRIKVRLVYILVPGCLLCESLACVQSEPAAIQRITVEENALLLDSRRLTPPITLEELNEVLGEPADRVPDYGVFVLYVWDAAGLAARVRADRETPGGGARVAIAHLDIPLNSQAFFRRDRGAPVFPGVISVAGVEITARTPNKAILRPGSPIQADEPGGRSNWTFRTRAFEASHSGRGHYPQLVAITPRVRKSD